MDITKVIIERAKTSDGKSLTYLSKRIFDDDSRRFLNRECGGPPGYSSEKVNLKLIRGTDYYKVRLEDYTTIGGIIISTRNQKGYIQRMFIDLPYQEQGIGKYVIDYIQSIYPLIEEWELETPCDNIRTNRFYSKCGFEIYDKNKGFNYYKKRIE